MNLRRAEHISRQNLELMARKNADYGSKGLELTGLVGIAVRLQDKISRLYNLSSSGVEPNNESLADTAMDIANYGLIAQLMLDGSLSSLPSMVYLAGSVRGVGFMTATTWRRQASMALAAHGVATFNPALAFSRPSDIPDQTKMAIEKTNRQAIDFSEVVLALLDHASINFGTIREIEYGKASGKRVVVVSDTPLEGKVSTYDVDLFSDLPSAVASILGVDTDSIQPYFRN